MRDPVYLDYNATTPMAPRVLEAMMPWFLTPSNAGSRTHVYGQRAKEAVESARKQVADLIDAKPEQTFFTSGATESNNIAILGLTEFGEKTGRKHIIATEIEHKAVLEPLAEMRRRGFEVDLAPVTSGGYVDPSAIRDRLRQDTLLVSVMHANNETGVLQPIQAIADELKTTPTLFHTDAAQTFGKVLSLKDIAFDMVSISGHKIYGPQGIGAFCVRSKKFDRRNLRSLTFGGGQERGLRPGTVPVPLAVGLGTAAELSLREGDARNAAAAMLKAKLLEKFKGADFQINGDQNLALPHVLNVSFTGIDSEALMMAIHDTIAISNGSACTSSLYKPSHVLVAMGFDEERIASSVRLSWGDDIMEVWADRLLKTLETLA
jgi:cysteine desulfurase